MYSIDNHQFVFEKSVSDEEKRVISANGDGRWCLYKLLNNKWILRSMDPDKHDIAGNASLRKKALTDEEKHNIIKVMNFSLNANYFMDGTITKSNKIYTFADKRFTTKDDSIHGNSLSVFFDNDRRKPVFLIWDDNEKQWSHDFKPGDIKYLGQPRE